MLQHPTLTGARYRITATSPGGKSLEAFAATWELALKVCDILAAQAGTEIEIGLSSSREPWAAGAFTWPPHSRKSLSSLAAGASVEAPAARLDK